MFWLVDVNEVFESISLTQVVFVSNKMKLKNFRNALILPLVKWKFHCGTPRVIAFPSQI